MTYYTVVPEEPHPNNIAHGGREQKLSEGDVSEYRALVVTLMNDLEAVLLDAVDGAHYRQVSGATAAAAAP